MSFTEVSGAAPDPDCLHCVLPPIVDKFRREHPGKVAPHLVNEILQVAAELLASTCPEREMPAALAAAQRAFAKCVQDAADGFRRAGLRPGARTQ